MSCALYNWEIMMDREEYSCDEEDWEHYDNLTSVSQNVNTVSGAQCPLWSPQGKTYYQHEDNQCQGEDLSGQHHDHEMKQLKALLQVNCVSHITS